MKVFAFFSIVPLILFSFGCSTFQTQTNEIQVRSENERPEGVVSDSKNYYRNLADYLRQVPGVNISGSGNDQKVTIRGVSSFYLGIEPLFVIDGTVIGTNYFQANNLINVWDIDYVRVLKGAEASIYGVRGGNGVILITTKQ